MPGIHRWWKNLPSERFWVEVTRRPDIGANLKAPQTNEQGFEFWSYSLIKEVQQDDVVYHYDGNEQMIIARSRATGVVWEGEVVWAARGSSARSANITPHSRPGWYFGLEQYERLGSPITLDAIRERVDAIRLLKASLEKDVGGPIYFPFEMGKKRPIRPMQGYLFKLPSAFLDLFAIEPERSPEAVKNELAPINGLGDEYRKADELAVLRERDPFGVDPALVERGVRGHAITQNALAAYLLSIGMEPRSPRADEPNFDVAWQGDQIFVAEVKSLTVTNEEKQLRLGLGQVLRYAQQLDRDGATATPVLVVERCPSDSSWELLCTRLGVILAWPDVFAERLVGRHANGATV